MATTPLRDPPVDAPEPTAGDAEVVRVLSMGSGGFDTAMQLGVTHALLVIQGRAPDAVVGLSAGAINAVALAEVLQAGEPPPEPVPGASAAAAHEALRTAYGRRLAARVTAFRRILDRLVRAPRELFHGMIPDAYQVDSREPLQTVEAPIFVQAERDARNESVANRAGLVRLYNHLLGLGLTFSTITQIVRRVLGITAAGEIRNPVSRLVVRLVEVLRLWVLAGANLLPISRLVPFFTVPPLRSWIAARLPRRLTGGRRKHGLSAGAIIFRFPRLEAAGRALLATLVFLGVLTVWVLLSLGLILLPLLASRALATSLDPAHAYALATAALAFVVVLTGPNLVEADRTTYRRLFYDTLKSLLVAGGLVAVWSVCFLVVVAVGNSAIGLVRGTASWFAFMHNLDLAWQQVSRWVVWSAGVVTILLVGVPVSVWLVRRGATPGRPTRNVRRLFNSILRRYRIESSLFSPYVLERLLADLFDPEHWGEAPMEDVVSDSLADELAPWPGDDRPAQAPKRKTVASYSRGDPSIHVGVTAANLATGKLDLLDADHSVVDSLSAGMAVVPFFPPRSLNGSFYVDGANVTTDAIQGVFKLLDRNGMLTDGRVVHIYPVMTLPVTVPSLPPDPITSTNGSDGTYVSLIDVSLRAMRLQRFRDATLERRLTELYSQVLPNGEASHVIDTQDEPGRRFVRSWVTPVEPPIPVGLNRRIGQAPWDEAKRLMLETVADGCRAALETMVRPSLTGRGPTMACASAVQRHLAARSDHAGRQGNDDVLAVSDVPLPGAGSGPDDGPGLKLVCSHCALCRPVDEKTSPQGKCSLSLAREWTSMGPAWPHELEERQRASLDERFAAPLDPTALATRRALSALVDAKGGADWPRRRPDVTSRAELPVRSLLFSGGVFRGVFQMGAVAALSELGVQPDLVAGASVGSLTAAMAAAVLCDEDKKRRDLGVARLAAVYLALDRVILTDRFADFIRNLTVRAGEARFSIRQADRAFRRFDSPDVSSYGSDLRRVLAGLERLFYVSPFEVSRLVEAVRDRRSQDVSRLLRHYAHEWLQRMNAGDEVLGTEPLRRLIDEYVLEVSGLTSATSIDEFAARFKIQFLLTATDLRRGRLEILGVPSTDPGQRTTLAEGLLASSAFPGVFRPRKAHELRIAESTEGQFIDGGTMDNLPLDAVAEFLLAAAPETAAGVPARDALLHRRPRLEDGTSLPHLVFAASLEVQPRLGGGDHGDMSWPELLKRTWQLGYNRKLDQYHRTQENLRSLYATTRSRRRGLTPLDLELLVVKPRWLCGTFAFHPMLGFRRRRQAQSIAHGCASTLVAFSARVGTDGKLTKAWGISSERLPTATDLSAAAAAHERSTKKLPEGRCWLAPDHLCPFSRVATRGIDLTPVTCDALDDIHLACSRPSTHGL